MNLQEFLNNNIVEGITKEVIISDRFVDENGKIMKFEIKAISQKELNELKKRASGYDKKGKLIINEGLLNMLCIIDNTVKPNFKDSESIKKLGCATPEQYLNKVLLAGEVERLTKEILEMSGFGQNINEMVDEIKN